MSLYPSPSFLYKNQLAKEGSDSVPPVVIPALAPSLDKSLKYDRSLCPVRALRYYLNRTSDLRLNKELVFFSFKKGFNKDISPAIIKQTVILCCEFPDQAFQSGVSFEWLYQLGIASHIIPLKMFTFQTHRSKDKGDTRPF